VFALPAFLISGSRVAARSALLCVAVFVVYVGWAFRDIAHVAAIATQGQHFSYGARILPAHLYHQVGAERWAAPAAVKQLVIAVPLVVATAAIAFRIRRRLGPRAEEVMDATASRVAFHLGALIYLGTFALANNFDYRLVFLLLPLPQLVEWARTPAHRLSAMASVTLVTVVLMLWVSSLSEFLHLWDELTSWAVAGLLAALVAATLPRLEAVKEAVLGRPPGLATSPSS